MTKSKMIAFVTVLYAIAEAVLYSVVSIAAKSFRFEKWASDFSDVFIGLSIIMLIAWVIVIGCIFFNEIKPKK